MIFIKILPSAVRLYKPIIPSRSLVQLHTRKINTQNTTGIKIVAEKLPRIKPAGPLNVWEVVNKISKDGKLMQFTIQEIPEDRYDDALEFMCTCLLVDEPISECLNAKSDPKFINDLKIIWRQMLEQSISIAAFIDNPDGGKPILAGLNMLGVEFKKNTTNVDDINFTSENMKNLFKVVMELSKEAQVYERYGIDKYMGGFGLSVAPAYRGYGLATQILKTREKIGHEYNIPVTSGTFTSSISQKSAERAGFEVLLARDYTDLVDKNGKEHFPCVKSKTIKIMARRIS